MPVDNGRIRIAITGSSGLLGTHLVRYFADRGSEIVRIVRRDAASGKDEVSWSPAKAEIDAERLEGLDAVIHLAGENIFGRWTRTKRMRILDSRRYGTELLASTLARLQNRPSVLVSASAVGFYGDSGKRVVDEDSPAGGNFLSEVCQAWEDATGPAEAAGIRTVRLRIGIVLSASGGALAAMRTPFKMGVGGTLGPGDQFMSWIHIDDLVRAIDRILSDTAFEGPVNAVAPNPVTNRQFSVALGKALRRPVLMRVPELVLNLMLGQMAEEVLLSGQRVDPKKLRANGFDFQFPDLSAALQDLRRSL